MCKIVLRIMALVVLCSILICSCGTDKVESGDSAREKLKLSEFSDDELMAFLDENSIEPSETFGLEQIKEIVIELETEGKKHLAISSSEVLELYDALYTAMEKNGFFIKADSFK